MSPQYFVSLMKSDLRRDTLRDLSGLVGGMAVFEACAHGEITIEEGVGILMLQREAEPWYWRLLRRVTA